MLVFRNTIHSELALASRKAVEWKIPKYQYIELIAEKKMKSCTQKNLFTF
jgi:hypothetical protein